MSSLISMHDLAGISGKTEVTEFDDFLLVDENILGLDITMDNVVRVTVCNGCHLVGG